VGSFSATLFVGTFAWGVTTGQPVPESDLGTAKKGDIFYTRFSLFYEQGHHVTTNYRRGTLLPVNSPLTFVKSGRNEILVTLPDGQEIVIENVKDYSGEDLNGVFRRTLSTAQTDLSQFSDAEKNAIEAGQAKVGMSKAAILIALGYPPKHQTPTLEGDSWRYWSSRYGTFIVRFEDGRVVEIIN
jgi:hypothetical protein